MPSNSTPIPTPKRLSRDLAARILDRAATLDATEQKVDVATLRAAAFDAGISPEAFERALAEAAVVARESVAAPTRTRVDATAGAIIGGGGALVGTFVHLLRTFRNRNK